MAQQHNQRLANGFSNSKNEIIELEETADDTQKLMKSEEN